MYTGSSDTLPISEPTHLHHAPHTLSSAPHFMLMRAAFTWGNKLWPALESSSNQIKSFFFSSLASKVHKQPIQANTGSVVGWQLIWLVVEHQRGSAVTRSIGKVILCLVLLVITLNRDLDFDLDLELDNDLLSKQMRDSQTVNYRNFLNPINKNTSQKHS